MQVYNLARFGELLNGLSENTISEATVISFMRENRNNIVELTEALKSNSSLTKLRLYPANREDEIGDEGARFIAEALQQNRTLLELTLRYSNIGAEGARFIARALQHNNTLEQIDLGSNNIRDEGARYIGEALQYNNTLRRVQLEENNIGAEGTRFIAEALHHNNTVGIIGFRSNNIGVEGARFIAEALQRNNTLWDIDLRDNNIGVEGARFIAEALQHNNTLWWNINLRSNNIGAEGARFIAEALQHNNTLLVIDLGDNNIGSEGARYIAEALQRNDALWQIHLSRNNIRDEGARYIAEALQHNNALGSIDLGDNNIEDTGAKHIAEGLKGNYALTSIGLERNRINRKLQEILNRLLDPHERVLVPLAQALDHETTGLDQYLLSQLGSLLTDATAVRGSEAFQEQAPNRLIAQFIGAEEWPFGIAGLGRVIVESMGKTWPPHQGTNLLEDDGCEALPQATPHIRVLSRLAQALSHTVTAANQRLGRQFRSLLRAISCVRVSEVSEEQAPDEAIAGSTRTEQNPAVAAGLEKYLVEQRANNKQEGRGR